MGSLGLPAIAMAVRSALALLCFALLCGLAASSSAVQSKTETELKEGEAAGNQVLVEEALESRVVRGSKQREISKACKKNPKRCKKQKNRRRNNQMRGKPAQRKKNPCKKNPKSNACKEQKEREKQKRGKAVQQRKMPNNGQTNKPSRKEEKKEKKN